MDYVQLESYYSKIIKNINLQLLLSSFDLILNDVRKLASVFSNLCFVFAKWSANKVSHLLASEALSKFAPFALCLLNGPRTRTLFWSLLLLLLTLHRLTLINLLFVWFQKKKRNFRFYSGSFGSRKIVEGEWN